jgi:hypothetical protein
MVGGKSDSSRGFMEKDFRDLVETGHQEGTLEESESASSIGCSNLAIKPPKTS